MKDDMKEEIKNLKILVHLRFESIYKTMLMLLSKCAVCDRKSKLIKEQEASALVGRLAIRKPLIKIPLVGHLLC